MQTQGDHSDLLCKQYEPKEVRQRLGLEKSNLVRFGYELSIAPHSTVSQLVRKCETQDVDSVHEFEIFCEEYIHAETSKVPLTPDQQGTLPIKNLDPRLSELAVQLGNDPKEPEVFLPISLDNPMRESAWIHLILKTPEFHTRAAFSSRRRSAYYRKKAENSGMLFTSQRKCKPTPIR
ncbi:uncharacterized protein J7T54_000861 [Emericellopsis cladophorae]|uniref:Asteroid domain-containing protein n=1 Tax=Emericellopsis cladophorae TaxID=2686198 RepID=A0A9P9Y3X1_9HYPO|nr:uncharacterized protein J7T54_000861 [Emericellopsis cladophorae]KAI6782718.1 hypothetical protein J7T54_000861 [Emericellopsis cladophorae]